ncbi:Integrator complex subunit 14 [Varanus komodoensis]|nr:Integrator complex subunit 14 [Varanus komodoensis]
MPTVVVMDVSLSMTRPVSIEGSEEYQRKHLAAHGLTMLFEHMATNYKLEFTALVVFSSLWELMVPFTRDYNTLQEALSNMDDYDKTCLESALLGVCNIVQQEWGAAIPCQVVLVSDGSLGIGRGSLRQSLATLSQRGESSRFPLPFPFPSKLYIMCMANLEELQNSGSLDCLERLIDLNNGEGQIFTIDGPLCLKNVQSMFGSQAQKPLLLCCLAEQQRHRLGERLSGQGTGEGKAGAGGGAGDRSSGGEGGGAREAGGARREQGARSSGGEEGGAREASGARREQGAGPPAGGADKASSLVCGPWLWPRMPRDTEVVYFILACVCEWVFVWENWASERNCRRNQAGDQGKVSEGIPMADQEMGLAGVTGVAVRCDSCNMFTLLPQERQGYTCPRCQWVVLLEEEERGLRAERALQAPREQPPSGQRVEGEATGGAAGEARHPQEEEASMASSSSWHQSGAGKQVLSTWGGWG